ncbi:LysE family transporter, partial [Nonomuraea sp. NPDC004297]
GGMGVVHLGLDGEGQEVAIKVLHPHVAADPKAAVFAMSFLPQFVPAGRNVPLTLVTLAVLWVLVDLLWYGLLIWAVGRAKEWLGRPAVKRRLEQLSGVVLVGLGVRMAVESR